MKTTLNIDDGVMVRLREAAARRGATLSALVEAALRLLLEQTPSRAELPDLPSFDGGGARVDLVDRDSLYQAMEGR